MSAGRALGQFPFVLEQVLEEVVAPLRGRRRPNDFQTAADGVSATTFAKLVLPSEPLVLDVGGFWFGAHIVSGNRGAVGLAERVSASDQSDRFFVVHGHAVKR